MNSQAMISLLTRALLLAGFAALVLAFAEGFAQLLGGSLVGRLYAASRLLEIAAVFAIFATALQVYQIGAARSDGT